MPGAAQVTGWSWEVDAVADELAVFTADDWVERTSGSGWTEIRLVQDHGSNLEVHPKLGACPTLQRIAEDLKGRILDMSLSRLAPGGSVRPHRDLSGGVAMGVARLHIPLITDDQVEFTVAGRRIRLAPGTVWLLDTTYVHSVANRSSRPRTHLIIDLRITNELRGRLPERTLRERVHVVYFWTFVCTTKAVSLARHPRALAERIRQAYRLVVHKESVL